MARRPRNTQIGYRRRIRTQTHTTWCETEEQARALMAEDTSIATAREIVTEAGTVLPAKSAPAKSAK